MRLLLPLLAVWVLSTQKYDLVIANGRVTDPASGLDAIRNLGIQDGIIAEISTSPI